MTNLFIIFQFLVLLAACQDFGKDASSLAAEAQSSNSKYESLIWEGNVRVVKHKNTNLMLKLHRFPAQVNFQSAAQGCETWNQLSYENGYKIKWRLPTEEEIKKLRTPNPVKGCYWDPIIPENGTVNINGDRVDNTRDCEKAYWTSTTRPIPGTGGRIGHVAFYFSNKYYKPGSTNFAVVTNMLDYPKNFICVAKPPGKLQFD